MNPSDAWLDFLRGWESLALEAYQDGAGVWTIGYGYTRGVRPGDTCDEDQANEWLLQEATHAMACVQHCVGVDLEDFEADALADFVYNLGSGAFADSELLRQLNLGRRAAVPAQFMRWINVREKQPDGTSALVPSEGLRKRRAAEVDMWINGRYAARP